jgi:hypothetical protein
VECLDFFSKLLKLLLEGPGKKNRNHLKIIIIPVANYPILGRHFGYVNRLRGLVVGSEQASLRESPALLPYLATRTASLL